MQMLNEEQMPRQLRSVTRLNWLQEEQDHLRDLYVLKGIKSWKQISILMRQAFPERCRTPKQYRQRYTNFVKFEGQKAERGSWTAEEDRVIFEKYMQLGSRWVDISKLIPGRSENNVKNRFYSALRKMVRRINTLLFQNKQVHNIRKPLKQASLFKLLETQSVNSRSKQRLTFNQDELHHFIMSLKLDCLSIAKEINDLVNEQLLFDLGLRIHRFNALSRFQFAKKSGNKSVIKRRNFPPISSTTMLGTHVDQKKEVQKQNMARSEASGNSISTDSIEACRQSDLLRADTLSNIFISERMMKQNTLNNLEYELCQILGTNYEPEEFSCL